MYTASLIRANSPEELLSKISLDSENLLVVRQRPFETRLAAIEFLQLKFNKLRQYEAIAAPVLLPMNAEYTEAIDELTALGKRLRMLPKGWSHNKAVIEKKLVEQNRRLSYMEQTQSLEPKKLHWVVYLQEGPEHGQVYSNRPLLQPSSKEQPHA